MDNLTITVMKDGTVTSDAKGEVFDLGGYGKLFVHQHVKVASNASQTLQLQHSAFNEDGAFEDLGSTLDIVSTGNDTQNYENFLRYVRFVASSSISTQPTLSLYMVAKES